MRILLVEDEPDLRRLLWTALEDESYAVDAAGDGHDALSKALATDYDAIILDVMLPGRDGWSVLQNLRARKATPVLMLTARDSVTDRVRGLDAGADDYLVKPFELSELRARLRALIRRSAGQAAAHIEIGDVLIDLAAQSVTRGGEAVQLTAKEYRLLEFLALHKGRLVTRTNIYNHLFDEYDDSLSNVVDVYISNLRRKLKRDVITTRRGQGYLIND